MRGKEKERRERERDKVMSLRENMGSTKVERAPAHISALSIKVIISTTSPMRGDYV